MFCSSTSSNSASSCSRCAPFRHPIPAISAAGAASGEQLTFENVILQNTTFADLGEGYLIYNAIDSGRSGYYITEGKAIEVNWTKSSENAITHYYDAKTGEEIEVNTGKTYISLIPSDGWNNVVIK